MVEFEDIHKRWMEYVKFVMENPKYQKEVQAIQKREWKLWNKIDRDLKWDDEGFKM